MCHAYDFDTPEGREIRASRGGTISNAVGHFSACGGSGYANSGNRVTINHSDGSATLYLHLQRVNVSNGAVVNQGAVIGLSGKTGWTGTNPSNCAPHLHFQRQAQGIWITNSQPIYFDEYPSQQLVAGSSYTSQNGGSPSGGELQPPSLREPANGAPLPNRTVTFRWNLSPSSGVDVYILRVTDDPNKIDSGPWLFDAGMDAPRTEHTLTLPRDGDFWWSVWACRGCKSGSPVTKRPEVRHVRITPPPPACSNPNPAANQVILFEHELYRGFCEVFPVNDGDLGNNQHGAEWASSIKVGANVQAMVCEHANFGGICEGFTADDPEFGNNRIFHDRVSSIRVDLRPSDCPNQYRAEYFNNRSLSGPPARIQCESWPINADWGVGSPALGVSADDFSVRWRARVQFSAGSYIFTGRGDDGIRAWIGTTTTPVIDRWEGNLPEVRVPLAVSAGYHDIRVEHQEISGAAVARFRWDQGSVPSAPTLVAPTTGAVFDWNASPPTFTWNAVAGATAYWVEFWRGSEPSISSGWQSGTTWTLTLIPRAGYEYSWRVKARNGAGESDWSPPQTFVVKLRPPSSFQQAGTLECGQVQLA